MTVQSFVKELEYYFEPTEDLVNYPSGLKWRVNKGKKIKAGKPAGNRRNKLIDGYHYGVQLDGEPYSVHGILVILYRIKGWEKIADNMYYRKRIHDAVPDHIDGLEIGNVKSNLQVTTNKENTRNKKIHREGKLLGTSFKTRENKWHAQNCDLKNPYLGSFKNEQLAHDVFSLSETMLASGYSEETIRKATLSLAKSLR